MQNVNLPRYVARVYLQVAVPFIKDWKQCHEAVETRAADYLRACIKRPLTAQRDSKGRSFPEWEIRFAEPGSLPVVGWA